MPASSILSRVGRANRRHVWGSASLQAHGCFGEGCFGLSKMKHDQSLRPHVSASSPEVNGAMPKLAAILHLGMPGVVGCHCQTYLTEIGVLQLLVPDTFSQLLKAMGSLPR